MNKRPMPHHTRQFIADKSQAKVSVFPKLVWCQSAGQVCSNKNINVF